MPSPPHPRLRNRHSLPPALSNGAHPSDYAARELWTAIPCDSLEYRLIVPTSESPTIRELSRLAFEARRQMRSVLRLARGRTFLENCKSNGRALWVRRPNFPVGGTVSPGGWRGW